MPIERALVSVHEKTGIVEFATRARAGRRRSGLHRRHGQAAARIRRKGSRSLRIDRLAGDAGRARKDLAPESAWRNSCFAAIGPTIGDETRKHGIAPIDLVVVNLYPFEATASRAEQFRRKT